MRKRKAKIHKNNNKCRYIIILHKYIKWNGKWMEKEPKKESFTKVVSQQKEGSVQKCHQPLIRRYTNESRNFKRNPVQIKN